MNLTVEDMCKCLDKWATIFAQNNMQKFFEDLFEHVLQGTEGVYYKSPLNYFPLAVDLYQRDIGSSIIQILSVAGLDIGQLFESIKEKIMVRENLKTFLVCLTDKLLCGQPEHELYYLTITSRIFTLMFRANILSPEICIEELVKTLLEHASKEEEIIHFPTLNFESLISDILENSNSLGKFRKFKCGEASDYFPS